MKISAKIINKTSPRKRPLETVPPSSTTEIKDPFIETNYEDDESIQHEIQDQILENFNLPYLSNKKCNNRQYSSVRSIQELETIMTSDNVSIIDELNQELKQLLKSNEVKKVQQNKHKGNFDSPHQTDVTNSQTNIISNKLDIRYKKQTEIRNIIPELTIKSKLVHQKENIKQLLNRSISSSQYLVILESRDPSNKKFKAVITDTVFKNSESQFSVQEHDSDDVNQPQKIASRTRFQRYMENQNNQNFSPMSSYDYSGPLLQSQTTKQNTRVNSQINDKLNSTIQKKKLMKLQNVVSWQNSPDKTVNDYIISLKQKSKTNKRFVECLGQTFQQDLGQSFQKQNNKNQFLSFQNIRRQDEMIKTNNQTNKTFLVQNVQSNMKVYDDKLEESSFYQLLNDESHNAHRHTLVDKSPTVDMNKRFTFLKQNYTPKQEIEQIIQNINASKSGFQQQAKQNIDINSPLSTLYQNSFPQSNLDNDLSPQTKYDRSVQDQFQMEQNKISANIFNEFLSHKTSVTDQQLDSQLNDNESYIYRPIMVQKVENNNQIQQTTFSTFNPKDFSS